MEYPPIANDQEAIRQAKEHMLKQGKKCFVKLDDNQSGCSYHDSDNNLACGIGGIMPLRMRIKAAATGGYGIRDLVPDDEEYQDYFVNCTLDVLEDIQYIHDVKPVEAWETLLDKLLEGTFEV